MTLRIAVLGTALTCAAIAHAAETGAELNRMLDRLLEDNARSAAYARACAEEPVSEQLKANTMMLLAVSGMEAHNVQLGSGKFNDIMRAEIGHLRSARKVDCPARVQEARERLTATQDMIHDSRRDAAPGN